MMTRIKFGGGLSFSEGWQVTSLWGRIWFKDDIQVWAMDTSTLGLVGRGKGVLNLRRLIPYPAQCGF